MIDTIEKRSVPERLSTVWLLIINPALYKNIINCVNARATEKPQLLMQKPCQKRLKRITIFNIKWLCFYREFQENKM